MDVFHGIDDSQLRKPTVLTLGVFDGLHLGHQAIVRQVVERALLTGATSTLITFDPHPRQVLKPETAPPLLQTFHQKMEGLRSLGIQQVVVLKFNDQLAALTADEFVEGYIHKHLEAREVFLGKGFAFGRDRQGNIDVLRELSRKYGFVADEVGEVRIRGHRISSTMIRRLLRAGRINFARRMLGRPYGIEGLVTTGRGVGRELLLPTANLDVQNRVIPADGVYVTLTLVDETWVRSVTNIGKRPTLGADAESKVETHLIDYEGDLYNRTVRVRLLHRLRAERKFSGIEELKAQIFRDRDRALRYFSSGLVKRNLRIG